MQLQCVSAISMDDDEAVQGFIKSQRAKLEQEKENLGMAVVKSR